MMRELQVPWVFFIVKLLHMTICLVTWLKKKIKKFHLKSLSPGDRETSNPEWTVRSICNYCMQQHYHYLHF